MSKELVISATRHETRVAVIEDDQPVEVYYQRENEYSLAGSIHKGRVTRVFPGMQSAFVDIGLDRDAFLYVSDFFEDNEEYDKIVTSVEDKVLKLDRVPQESVPAAPAPESVPAAPEPDEATPEAVVELAAGSPLGPAPGSAVPIPDPRRDDHDRRGRRLAPAPRAKGRGPWPAGLQVLLAASRRSAGPGEPATPKPRKRLSSRKPAAATLTPENEFFVLPGETLARHTPQAWEEPESAGPAFPATQPEEPESAEPVAAEAAVEPTPRARRR